MHQYTLRVLGHRTYIHEGRGPAAVSAGMAAQAFHISPKRAMTELSGTPGKGELQFSLSDAEGPAVSPISAETAHGPRSLRARVGTSSNDSD